VRGFCGNMQLCGTQRAKTSTTLIESYEYSIMD
jgi:hypothetical protein